MDNGSFGTNLWRGGDTLCTQSKLVNFSIISNLIYCSILFYFRIFTIGVRNHWAISAKNGVKLGSSMLYSLKNANNQAAKSRKAVLLVTLMLSSLFLSLIPAVSASHITQYAVQRDPSYISIGDLDCDGHNDIASASTMGLFITVLYNDGSGGFADRQDVFISNNESRRAGFVDTADGTRVEIADIDGDGVNDLVYYQQNIRFVGESFVRPGNLTILWGDCQDRVNLWSDSEITVSNPYLADMDLSLMHISEPTRPY